MKAENSSKTVVIVGAGISSLMIALKLHENGYKIVVYTKGPDPRKDRKAEQYGSTGNGRMGRFITGFEGETYLSDTSMYPDMKWAFEHPVSDGGWLAKPISEFSKEDQVWLQKRAMATENQEIVHELFESYYIKHNKESIHAWQELFKNKNFLFYNTDSTDPFAGVLRLYDNQKLFDTAIETHSKYGFLKEKLSLDEVANKFPIYKNACEQGLIAGGIIAEGFSFNILQFADNVINYLEQEGVTFVWNTEIEKIELDENGFVLGLSTKTDELITSDYYSINPGAYGIGLLDNTPAKGKLGGVAGRWLVMPRPAGYNTPTKIHGDRRSGFPVTDNNLTPYMENGKPMIAVGGGYVYVGSNEKEYANQEAYKVVDEENERTIKLYFGQFYEEAKRNGEIEVWTNTCVRSFTYDDKPVHEVMKTKDGGVLTITAGTNTGTTTIAPYLAEWTFEMLK